jgi:N-acetylglutamate synthase-like GNAT family acetyltransferase
MKRGIGSKLINNLIKKIKLTKEPPKAKLITVSTKIPFFFSRLGFKNIEDKYDRDYNLMALKI